jgi:hypothetical protein
MEDSGEGHQYWRVLLPLWLLPVDGLQQPMPSTRDFPELAHSIEELFKLPRDEAVELLENRLTPMGEGEEVNPLTSKVARFLLLHYGEVDTVIDYDIVYAPADFPSGTREFLWTPLFEQYRAHPRFPELLHRVGLIEYWDETEWSEACRREEDGRVTCR